MLLSDGQFIKIYAAANNSAIKIFAIPNYKVLARLVDTIHQLLNQASGDIVDSQHNALPLCK